LIAAIIEESRTKNLQETKTHLLLTILKHYNMTENGSNGSMMGFTPYEQVKIGHMQAKRPSGTAIAGLVVGVGAAVLAVGAGAWAGAKAKEAKEVGKAYTEGIDKRLDNIGALLESEVNRRIQGDINITQSVADTISGQQSTNVENSAMATAYNQIITDALTGRSSLNAQPVCIYSAPQPCGCPGGCGR